LQLCDSICGLQQKQITHIFASFESLCNHPHIQIINMEETILKTLEYQITIPSAHAFLVRYLKAAHADKKIVQLSCYILDGTLQSYQLLHYLPSQLAAAAVFIA